MITPNYEAGTLADVLPGALAALGMPGLTDRLGLAEKLGDLRGVAILLVDGMGYHQLPLLGPFLSGAPAGRITCGFPSTTPVSLASFATGVPPGQHGLLAFTCRVPGTDKVLNHVLWRDNPPPRKWQPVPPLYVAAQNFAPVVVNRPEYVGSGLTEVTTRGAAYWPATSMDEVGDGIIDALARTRGIVYGYTPDLDKAGHAHGVGSPQWRVAASNVDGLVSRIAENLPPGTALIVTADHGQFNVPSDRRIDLDQALDGVRVLAGEPRVRYLHTEAGARDDVLATWRELAGHAAWVGTREEAIAQGWYGPVDPSFEERIGDVVMVCRDDWALMSPGHDNVSVLKLVAMHGGMTEAEMAVPLIVVPSR